MTSLISWSPVTGPVARFARQIAGQGYIVAAPSSYHEFTGPEPLAYDVPGTDAGNEYKIKKVSAPDMYANASKLKAYVLATRDLHCQEGNICSYDSLTGSRR